jgi:prolyl-tRNA synthetase
MEKRIQPVEGIGEHIEDLLDAIQQNIFDKALKFRKNNTYVVDSWEEFKGIMDKGGFVMAHWDGTTETEMKIKEETKATIRCIPFGNKPENGKCIYSGKPSKQRVLFAVAY